MGVNLSTIREPLAYQAIEIIVGKGFFSDFKKLAFHCHKLKNDIHLNSFGCSNCRYESIVVASNATPYKEVQLGLRYFSLLFAPS